MCIQYMVVQMPVFGQKEQYILIIIEITVLIFCDIRFTIDILVPLCKNGLRRK